MRKLDELDELISEYERGRWIAGHLLKRPL